MFYKYEITNAVYNAVDAADTLKEAVRIIARHKAEDRAHGFLNTHYHVFEIDRVTGERLFDVSANGKSDY